ncbi:MAG: lipoate--protein ligase [Clostridiaceae bacterium]|nr:lipoate--protein ligase [Eubacteriales bacterium]
MNRLIITKNTDPWHNLALEEHLFDTHEAGFTLYLWQNQNTVVIGRNQNAWKECRLSLLEQEGGRLARRTSGGGAVFHDLGNLNFTFLATRGGYDVRRQLSVITEAVKSLGVDARFTGRNDILAFGKTGEPMCDAGAKFSGNAFRLSGAAGLHHGTLLVRADMEKLSRYLAPSEDKLKAKGIESVRARVCNLSDYLNALSIDDVKEAVTRAFAREYGETQTLFEEELDQSAVARIAEKHASRTWRLGETPAFDMELYERFPWGGLELQLSFSRGKIANARAFSDAMDENFILRIPEALTGCSFESAAMAEAVKALSCPEAEDVAAWLMEKGF